MEWKKNNVLVAPHFLCLRSPTSLRAPGWERETLPRALRRSARGTGPIDRTLAAPLLLALPSGNRWHKEAEQEKK